MSEAKYTDKKDVIWKAYKEVLTELNKAQKAQPTTTVEAAQIAKVEKAVETASAMDIDAISEVVGNLLNNIADATDKYNDIIEAIGAKEKELKDILGLEREANSLVAVVATKDALVAEKEEQAKTIVADAQEKADEVIANAKLMANEISADAAKEEADRKKARARDEEEYKYNFDRKKQKDLDSLQDVLDGKVKAIKEREDAVAEREAEADGKDAKIAELEKDIENFIASTDEKIEEAVAKAKKSAETSANIAKAMDKKTHEAEISIKDAKIVTLEEKVAELNAQVVKLQAQVADANAQVITVANNALDNQKNAEAITRIAELNAQGNGKK